MSAWEIALLVLIAAPIAVALIYVHCLRRWFTGGGRPK